MAAAGDRLASQRVRGGKLRRVTKIVELVEQRLKLGEARVGHRAAGEYRAPLRGRRGAWKAPALRKEVAPPFLQARRHLAGPLGRGRGARLLQPPPRPT